MSDINKVVLAYSGGLDTSVILRWLQENYGCEVVTFTADIGQGEEVEPARAKARTLGVKEIFIEDLREAFARDYVYPMFRANTVYEGEYLLAVLPQIRRTPVVFGGGVRRTVEAGGPSLVPYFFAAVCPNEPEPCPKTRRRSGRV